ASRGLATSARSEARLASGFFETATPAPERDARTEQNRTHPTQIGDVHAGLGERVPRAEVLHEYRTHGGGPDGDIAVALVGADLRRAVEDDELDSVSHRDGLIAVHHRASAGIYGEWPSDRVGRSVVAHLEHERIRVGDRVVLVK